MQTPLATCIATRHVKTLARRRFGSAATLHRRSPRILPSISAAGGEQEASMRGVLLCVLTLNSIVVASYLTPSAIDVGKAVSHLVQLRASAKPKLPPGLVTLGMPLASGAFGKVRLLRAISVVEFR